MRAADHPLPRVSPLVSRYHAGKEEGSMTTKSINDNLHLTALLRLGTFSIRQWNHKSHLCLLRSRRCRPIAIAMLKNYGLDFAHLPSLIWRDVEYGPIAQPERREFGVMVRWRRTGDHGVDGGR